MVELSNLREFCSIVAVFQGGFIVHTDGGTGIRCRRRGTAQSFWSSDAFSEQHIIETHQLRIRWFLVGEISNIDRCKERNFVGDTSFRSDRFTCFLFDFAEDLIEGRFEATLIEGMFSN